MSWSAFLLLAEFALNNAVHGSIGLEPFFVDSARHSRVSTLPAVSLRMAYCSSTQKGMKVINIDQVQITVF